MTSIRYSDVLQLLYGRYGLWDKFIPHAVLYMGKGGAAITLRHAKCNRKTVIDHVSEFAVVSMRGLTAHIHHTYSLVFTHRLIDMRCQDEGDRREQHFVRAGRRRRANRVLNNHVTHGA